MRLPSSISISYREIFKWNIVLLYFSTCLSGILQFYLWPQVISIWDNGGVHSAIPAHIPRYLLVLPIFKVAKLIGADYNYLFSALVPFIIYMSASYISRSVLLVLKKNKKRQEELSFSFAFLAIAFISLFMNGRIIFSILASAILLNTAFFWRNFSLVKISFKLFVGFFLSSVSSGTFLVYFLGFFIILVLNERFSGSKSKIRTLFFLITSAITAFPLLLVFVAKNIDFYGGGWNGVLGVIGHGFGVIFLGDKGLAVNIMLILLIFFCTIYCAGFLFFLKKVRPAILLFLVSIAGGIFGYSALMMIVPPAIFLLYFLICHLLKLGTGSYSSIFRV